MSGPLPAGGIESAATSKGASGKGGVGFASGGGSGGVGALPKEAAEASAAGEMPVGGMGGRGGHALIEKQGGGGGGLGKRGSTQGKDGKEPSKSRKLVQSGHAAGVGAQAGPVAVMQGPREVISPKPSQAHIEIQICAAQGEHSEQGGVYLESTRQNAGTSIVCKRANGEQIWSDSVKDEVAALAGNEHLAVVATSDSALYFFSKCGRRTLPAVVLSDRIAHLEVQTALDNPLRTYVIAVTADGMLHTWDAVDLKETCRTSIAPLVRGGGVVKKAWLSCAGAPVLAMSNGCCYTYHAGMNVMMRIADDQFQASSLSTFTTPSTSSLPAAPPPGPTGPLSIAVEFAKRNWSRPEVMVCVWCAPAVTRAKLLQLVELCVHAHTHTRIRSLGQGRRPHAHAQTHIFMP